MSSHHSIPLDQMVDYACNPELVESNLSLNLEICDLINQKGKNSSREVAMAITRNINKGNQRGAQHALALLDICVKNCGYPFHLIISSKEFLNELVKRFPERPTTIGPIQYHILEIIQLWHSTLCVTSRHKDDFKNINDMYRLLQYKGYRFPKLNPDATVVLRTEVLKTEEELEQEDKLAQGAKLQELLRIGTPAALEQANELMKVMAGYDLEKRPDYKKEVEKELDRIEQKIFAFNDKLLSKTGEKYSYDPVLEDLYASAISSQSRIQKIIEDIDENTADRVERLLELNDTINTVLENFNAFKSGKLLSISKISLSSKEIEVASKKVPQMNLIDLDDVFSVPPTNESIYGGISLPLSSISPQSPSPVSTLDLLEDLMIASNNITSVKHTNLADHTVIKHGQPNIQNSIIKDFSDVPAFSPQASPDLKNVQKSKEAFLFNKNGLQIKLLLIGKQGEETILNAVFINTTPVTFTNLSFQVAVPKIMKLRLDPLSSTNIAPLNTAQTTQTLRISNVINNEIRLRFKVSYAINGAVVEETGEHPSQ
ncbi:VHS domain-containing protein [Cladochytrium replicatum]|nr:VHS domain-containing protein [Cladochytrium replicatum]